MPDWVAIMDKEGRKAFMYYFAYGANMDPKRLQEAGVTFAFRERARVLGYKVLMNKKGELPKEGRANIIESAAAEAEGVLYKIEEKGMSVVEDIERYPVERERIYVTVVLGVTKIHIGAYAYVARPSFVGENLAPTNEYVDHMVAASDKLSVEYIRKLEGLRGNRAASATRR